MANILRKWVESDKREIGRLGKIADQVQRYEDEYAALSDDQLKANTQKFKDRLAAGAT